MVFVRLMIVAVVALGISSITQAAVIDGTVGGGEYDNVTLDALEGLFGDAGLDIAAIGIEVDGGELHIGVDTDGPFDPDGDPTSIPAVTGFLMQVLDDTFTPLFAVLLEVYDSGATIDMTIIDFVADTETDFDDTDAVTIGADMEIAIDLADLPTLPSDVNFVAQLDGTGFFNDDQIDGGASGLPEPASLALLGIGALVMTRRR